MIPGGIGLVAATWVRRIAIDPVEGTRWAVVPVPPTQRQEKYLYDWWQRLGDWLEAQGEEWGAVRRQTTSGLPCRWAGSSKHGYAANVACSFGRGGPDRDD
jgi:hypothetical protein